MIVNNEQCCEWNFENIVDLTQDFNPMITCDFLVVNLLH